MEFYEEIVAVKKPHGELLPALEKAYGAIGHKFGYTPIQSPLWLMLARPGSQVGFEIQFGSVREYEESLKHLAQSDCELCIFITSSKSRTMRLEDARALLLRRFEIKEQHWVFIDIESGKWVGANFEWDKFAKEVDRPDWSRPGPLPTRPLFRQTRETRRKEIRGRRGEHKEQD